MNLEFRVPGPAGQSQQRLIASTCHGAARGDPGGRPASEDARVDRAGGRCRSYLVGGGIRIWSPVRSLPPFAYFGFQA